MRPGDLIRFRQRRTALGDVEHPSFFALINEDELGLVLASRVVELESRDGRGALIEKATECVTLLVGTVFITCRRSALSEEVARVITLHPTYTEGE